MHKFALIPIFLAAALCFADETLYQKLLEHRLKHDNDYKYLKLEAEIAENNFLKLKTSSFVNLSLGTGDMAFTLGGKGKSGFSMVPYAGILFPKFNNTGINITVPYSAAGETHTYGAGINVSTDIFTQNRRKHKLELSQAEQTVIKARRKSDSGGKLAEKKLLKDIQTLFTEYITVLDKAVAETQAKINFNQIKIQGYGENSAKLRSSKLSLLTAEREHKQADFSFSITYRRFLESCGIQEPPEISDFLDRLSASIPDKDVINIEEFTASDYSVIQDAEESFRQNIEAGKIAGTPVSVSAQAGYNFTKSKSKSTAVQHSTPQDSSGTVNTDVDFNFPGGKITAGVSVPGKEPSASQLKLGLSFNPFAVHSYILDKKNAEMQNEIEALKLSDLKNSFEIEFKTIKISSEQLQWQKKVSAEELEIYKKNAEDHISWFKNGFISLFEKEQAELEYKKAVTRNMSAKIAVFIFNIDTSMLFLRKV